MSYKEEQESFVSNHNGTSVAEIFLVSAALPVLCNLLYFMLLGSVTLSRKWQLFAVQYTVLVLPVLFFFTCFADHSHWLGTLIAAVPPILFFRGYDVTSSPAVREVSDTSSVAAAITAFRAYVNIATATAILAVDFTVFPRRFAKAETYGTGLMDVGVGLYVFSMALVSREARQQPGESLVRGWKTLAALLLLGCGRLVTTKATAYQEHASEYGVHWNFFFTLAVLKILTILVGVAWRQTRLSEASSLSFWTPLLTSVVSGCGYQLLLQCCGLSEFVRHSWDGTGSRPDLISANREGIFSTVGYFSLYCAVVQLGRCLWSFSKGRRRAILVAYAVTSGMLLFCASQLEVTEPISRRLANLPFILWQVSHGSSVLLGFYLLYSKFRSSLVPGRVDAEPCSEPCLPAAPPQLLSAISKHQLLFFLAANLLTGAVNMSIQTIYTPSILALPLLAGYLFSLCLLAVLMH